MAKGKTPRKKERSIRTKQIQANKKIKREKKKKAVKEKWTNDKTYLEEQARKGYKKVNDKWIRTPQRKQNDNNK